MSKVARSGDLRDGRGRGSHELLQSSAPELVAFRFREVGVVDQKSVPIARDGPGEQFVVRLGDSHEGRYLLSVSMLREGDVQLKQS